MNILLSCRPLSKYWNPLQPGICESGTALLSTNAILNTAPDLFIVDLPMPMVWGIQMAVRKKLELTIIFALGFLHVPRK